MYGEMLLLDHPLLIVLYFLEQSLPVSYHVGTRHCFTINNCSFVVVFPQWNLQMAKYKLAVECQLVKLTSDPWKTLDDCANLYKGSLTMPYVSCSSKRADITDYMAVSSRCGDP